MTVPTDPFNFANGAIADADQVDSRFLPLYTALNGALDVDNLVSTLKEKVGVSDGSVTRRGSSNIAVAGTRTSTGYGALSNGPDQVANLVLPSNGLILVGFSAAWQESVSSAGRAALFLGSNQVKVGTSTAVAPAVQEAGLGGTAATSAPLTTGPIGLASGPASNYSGSVTTGQILAFSAANLSAGGFTVIFAAAGTYTVSVQFKSTSGTITASDRKLWALALGF